MSPVEGTFPTTIQQEGHTQQPQQPDRELYIRSVRVPSQIDFVVRTLELPQRIHSEFVSGNPHTLPTCPHYNARPQYHAHILFSRSQ